MRKTYLDNIRWIVVALVVVYHVFYMYNAEGVLGGVGPIAARPVQYWDLYQYAVYPWFMPLLFIVSGICSRHDLEKHTGREFLKKRTVRLLVPSTVGLFAFQFLQGAVSMGISGALGAMSGTVPGVALYFILCASGIGVLWYIQLLWVLSVILLLIRKIEKDRLWRVCRRVNVPVLILLAIPVWGAAQILNTPVVIVYRFGLYGLVFLCGYFVFSHETVMAVLKKWFPLFLVIAAAAGVAFCVVFFGSNFADAPVNRTPLFTVFCWFACLAALGAAAKKGDFENRFTRWMSRRSFGLYVFHYLGVSAFALLVGKNSPLPVPLTYLLTLVAGFAVGYLLNALISRIPGYRWAVLGIRKRSKPSC